MTVETLKAPGRTLGGWLSEISRGGWTGKLRISHPEGDREFFFVAGDLYLSSDHPAFEAAEAWVEESVQQEPGEEAEEEPSERNAALPAPPFQQLAGPILSVTADSEDQECVFVSGAGQIPLNLAGPLPTKELIMECAIFGMDESGLLRRLGGDKVALQARAGAEAAMGKFRLQPGEGFLLSRLDTPVTLNELMNQVDMGKEQILRALCRLQAVDLVMTVEDREVSKTSAEPKGQLTSRFERRIGSSLEEQPLEIGPDQHRELLGNLLARMGEMTYFEMLAVSAQSSNEEIHQAYYELGRLVHPSHAQALGLQGKEGAFRVLFELATDAYLTLNDPERKLDYLREAGPAPQYLTGGPAGETRDHEKQEVAREHYERALGMAERQDFHSAIQLLEQAVKVDPQAEYLTLLGDCQAENPQWLDRAAFNYKQALQVRRADPSINTRLGRVYERQGDQASARRAYEAALEVAPEMEDAKAGLWRVGGGAAIEKKVSLADKLRSLFHGRH
jgi:tetratricopeptide (TPR) repeat protein